VKKQPRRLVWGLPPNGPSRRPLRDAALLYAVFAVVVVVIGVATGGSLVRSVAIAAVAYCLAVAWTAWRRR
jgi:Flp pilus assembly protein TadB